MMVPMNPPTISGPWLSDWTPSTSNPNLASDVHNPAARATMPAAPGMSRVALRAATTIPPPAKRCRLDVSSRPQPADPAAGGKPACGVSVTSRLPAAGRPVFAPSQKGTAGRRALRPGHPARDDSLCPRGYNGSIGRRDCDEADLHHLRE